MAQAEVAGLGGPPVQLVGIILAAGDGERMGGSKALLLVGDEPLAIAHARRALEAGCARVVVTVRPEVAPKLSPPQGVTLVSSTAADPAGSLAVGLRALGLEPDTTLLITPVDCAPVRAPTIARLLEALDGGALAATPRFQGRGGHPVACRASVLAPYTSGRGPLPPLREILRELGDRRTRVELDDPLVAVDLDTPEDVVALTGEMPRFAP